MFRVPKRTKPRIAGRLGSRVRACHDTVDDMNPALPEGP